jgi:anti-anti-sigma regulatory factor
VVDASEVENREIRLGETLDIAAVQSLHGELKAAMAGDDTLSVDGSQVTRVDTASLQVLAAMFVYADLHERDVVLRAPSQALVQAAALLGVNECFGLKVKENC